MTSHALAPVTYQTPGGHTIELSADTIRRYIAPNSKPSDEEIFMFMKICESQRLNPFLREAYLIKYGQNPASFVVGWHVFLARAESNPEFDGYEWEVYNEADEPYRGEPNTKIKYAEAKVYRKDRKYPVVVRALMKEYSTGRSNWDPDRGMPATMIRKVALSQALREAFVKELSGLYTAEEMRVGPDSGDGSTQMRHITQSTPSIQPAYIIEPDDDTGEEEVPTTEAVQPAQEPFVPKPAQQLMSPFAVVKFLTDLHGPRWSMAKVKQGGVEQSVTAYYFGKQLRNIADMEVMVRDEPAEWTDGVKRIAEAMVAKNGAAQKA